MVYSTSPKPFPNCCTYYFSAGRATAKPTHVFALYFFHYPPSSKSFTKSRHHIVLNSVMVPNPLWRKGQNKSTVGCFRNSVMWQLRFSQGLLDELSVYWVCLGGRRVSGGSCVGVALHHWFFSSEGCS